jgi:hypothetical protein
MATAAQLKAERIAAEEEARIQAYQNSLKTPAQQRTDAMNATVSADPDVIAAKAMAAEIAGLTGQDIDPKTGQIIIDPAKIAAKVAATPGKTLSGGTPADTSTLSDSDKDAYALLKETFTNYGLASLIPAITKLMKNNVGPNQASLLLKTDPEYNAEYVKRFNGNKKRVDAGLNALSEAEYLDLENSYKQTLQAYGQANYFGTNKDIAMGKMADLIAGDVSALEFKERIDTVVTRVNNADPSIKSTLTSFFDIKDTDLVSYFLNPKEGLPKLQEKVTAAEIGAAAKGQDLATSAAAATALAQFGVTKAQAQEGYATIGEIMPTATKLGDIYGNKYDQATAEAEVFKGTASAKRKRQQLAEQEVASFSGSSGRLRTGQQSSNTGSF